ncbi:hypothetical protein A2U01_0091400, partial [Trifolium medium]|nr:hypothetical protein [Trifolium medium]
ISWVEEFYANALGYAVDDYTSIVRGKTISYAPDVIDAFLDSDEHIIAGPASRELEPTLMMSILRCSRHWLYQGEIGATLPP